MFVPLNSEPSAGRVVRTLKEGYWDRTEVIELENGSHRVRKHNTATAKAGPWGVESLRREIRYLQTLSPRAATVLPQVLACWDTELGGTPEIGYEMPFYAQHTDAGELAKSGVLSQAEIDEFQDHLAEALLNRLHEPAAAEERLSHHIVKVVRHALDELETESVLAPLIRAENIELNELAAAGPRVAFERILSETDVLSAIDEGPCVRVHGDLFLENILWRSAQGTGPEPRLVLVDPVSVAGISCAPPLFDLVKYESYAKGELLALRSERVDVEGFASGGDRYAWKIRWSDPALTPFAARNWHARFRRAFLARYGEPEPRLYRLIDGYFSVAMALNTRGVQRQARLLKATSDFNAVLVTAPY
jgi:hypothetical protein